MDMVESPTPFAGVGQGADGLISWREARAEGLGSDDIRHLVHRGHWVPVRRGWYTTADHWSSLDDRWGRPLLSIRAAHRGLLRPHVVSHTSAAMLLGLPILRPRDDLVHVTKYGAPRARVRNGIKHHQSRYRIDDVHVVDGLPVLGLARTVLDIARESGFTAGVCAIDAARQRGVSLADLWAARRPMWRWPWVTVVDDAILFSNDGAESLGETLTRTVVAELDLGPIDTQFELRDQTGWARCDMRVGRHVFEFDGLVKLQPRSSGGVAERPAAEEVAAEKRRQDWVCGFELGMSRVTWPELWGAERARLKARLLREYAATTARYGTNIDDLAPYVVRRPRAA